MSDSDAHEEFDLAAELESRRLRLSSADVVSPRVEDLASLFPEAVSDGKIDLERLAAALGDVVDDERESFGLSWPGKREAIRAAQRPSEATLEPMPEESVNWDETKNVFIEGENLEVLKVLQRSYHGKVKLIYIDPPYNTGKDFVYPDNYADPLGEYLRYSGQVDEAGARTSANTETSGRYHSAWLSMMWPRLQLARNLLALEGLICVSIGDAEESHLTMLLDEVFGEENRVSRIVWKSSYGGGSKVKHVVGLHEYILIYARDRSWLPPLVMPPDPEARRRYRLTDEREPVRGPYRLQPLATTSNDSRPNLRYPIQIEGEEIWPEKQWQWSRERVDRALATNLLVAQGKPGQRTVYYKQYLRDEDGVERGAKPYSVLDSGPYTQQGTADLDALGLKGQGFSFPKPVDLIVHLLGLAGDDALVLDFFAGSGTTAEAVYKANSSDGGNRRWVLVQLPERFTDADGQDTSIAAFARERIRRAATAQQRDGQAHGFRAFELVSPLGSAVPATELQLPLETHCARPPVGLTAVLLTRGYELSCSSRLVDLHGASGTLVEDEFLVLLAAAGGLTTQVFEAIVASEPLEIVLAESAFSGNDELKLNALQHLKTVNAHRTTPIELWLV